MTTRVSAAFDEHLKPLHLNWDVVAVVVLFFGSFALYARTAVPGVLDADGGEFQTNIFKLGVSHTGYPLYFILAKLWTLLMPVGTIAYRANVFSSLFGALTLVLIYGLLRTLTAHRSVAFLIAVLFGVSRVEWSQALIPDVYTLNSFFIVLVLWLAILWRMGRIPLWALAFAYGLSLTHHRTMIMLAPALGIFVLVSAGRSLWNVKTLLLASVALLLPLLLYLYIPLRGESDVGVEYHAKNFGEMILASNVSVWLRFGPPGFLLDRVTQTYFPLLVEQFTPLGFLFGLIGIVALALKRLPKGFPSNLPARQLLLLILLAHLGETAFAVPFWVYDSEIFFIPSYLTFLIFVGIGFASALDWISTLKFGAVLRLSSTRVNRLVGVALVILFLAACDFLLWHNFPLNDQSGNDQADTRWQEILSKPLETHAILLAPWEDLTPLEYYQYVEGKRTDLQRDKIVVYQQQLALAPNGDLVAQVRHDLDRGAGVYLTRHPDDTETLKALDTFDLVPFDSLWRLQTHVKPLPNSKQTFADDDELHSFSLSSVTPQAGDFVTLNSVWSPDAPLEQTRFVLSLKDAADNVWSQQESLPFGGRAPDSSANNVRDLQGLFVPPDAPPGKYTIELASFARDSQQPISIVGDSNVVTRTLNVLPSDSGTSSAPIEIAHPLQAQIGSAELLGYDTTIAQPRGGDIIELSTWWQGLDRGDHALEVKMQDANGAESILYQGAVLPLAQGKFNPTQVVRARTNLTIPPTAPPGYANLILALDGQALPPIRLPLEAGTRKFTEPPIPHSQVVLLGDSIQLLGYKLDRTQFHPGESLLLTLYWNASRTPPASYKVFVHLVDANGALRAQQDSIPMGNTLPTNRWFPGEYISDHYAVALPADLAPGTFSLQVGMYDPTTGVRVLLTNTNAVRLPDDAATLTDTVTVTR